MKRRVSVLAACLLLCLAACSNEGSQVGQKPPNGSLKEQSSVQPSTSSFSIVDKTAKNAERFSVDGLTVIGDITGAADTELFYDNIQELYDGSPYIVYGRVEELGYWDESGTGFTLCNFVVEKSYKGELMPGDKISVLAAGGYYRLSKYIELNGKDRFPDLTDEEIQTSVYKTAYMGAPLVEKGEKYLLFLDQILDEPPFPDGVYTETGAFMGRFYYKDTETLMRYTPENQPDFYQDPETRGIAKPEFTLPELEAEIAACAE